MKSLIQKFLILMSLSLMGTGIGFADCDDDSVRPIVISSAAINKS